MASTNVLGITITAAPASAVGAIAITGAGTLVTVAAMLGVALVVAGAVLLRFAALRPAVLELGPVRAPTRAARRIPDQAQDETGSSP